MSETKQELNDARIKVIQAIQEAGNFWDAVATSDCIRVVKEGKQKGSQEWERAVGSMARCEAAEKLAREAIEIVNRCWPRDHEWMRKPKEAQP